MMQNLKPLGRLLIQTIAATVICALLFIVCYFFVDRPVAEFVYRHHFARFEWLKWLTYPPPVVQTWSPLIITGLIARRAWGVFSKFELTLLVSLISLIVADQFRESLQSLFGRDWPETWIDKNPSLIGTGAYGFHFFEGDEEFGSFPSGHAARTLAFLAPWWFAFPRARWFYVVAALAVCLGLVAMNYHFLGDVIAGGFLGFLVGMWSFRLAEFQSWRGEATPPGRSCSKETG